MLDTVPETFFWHIALSPDWLSRWDFELHHTGAGYYWRMTPEVGSAIYFTPVFKTRRELFQWRHDRIEAVPSPEVVQAEWNRRFTNA